MAAASALVQMLLCAEAAHSCIVAQGDPVDAEAAAELLALVAPGDAQLAAAFASSALAPRVAALCMLHSWAQHAQQPMQPDSPAAQQQQAAAGEAGQQILRQLLTLALEDPELSAARYSALGLTHRKKVRWDGTCQLHVQRGCLEGQHQPCISRQLHG